MVLCYYGINAWFMHSHLIEKVKIITLLCIKERGEIHMEGNGLSDEIVLLLISMMDEEQLYALEKIAGEDQEERRHLKGLIHEAHYADSIQRQRRLKNLLNRSMRDDTRKLSVIYQMAGFSRQLWNSFFKGRQWSTEKSRILRLAVLLRLNEWDAIYLLHLSGYDFPHVCDQSDITVLRCLSEKCYDPDQINEKLQQAGEPELF